MAINKSICEDSYIQAKIAGVCNKAEFKKLDPLIEVKFLRYVKKTSNCWIWTGSLSKSGYGNFRVGKNQIKPHRLSYTLYVNNIEKGKLICHKCDNKKCVNPKHLFKGTNQDNMTDAMNKGRLAYGERNGKYTHPGSSLGENNGRAKLTEKDVVKIRTLFKSGKFSKRKIAKMFSITDTMACFTINRKNWKHV